MQIPLAEPETDPILNPETQILEYSINLCDNCGSICGVFHSKYPADSVRQIDGTWN